MSDETPDTVPDHVSKLSLLKAPSKAQSRNASRLKKPLTPSPQKEIVASPLSPSKLMQPKPRGGTPSVPIPVSPTKSIISSSSADEADASRLHGLGSKLQGYKDKAAVIKTRYRQNLPPEEHIAPSPLVINVPAAELSPKPSSRRSSVNNHSDPPPSTQYITTSTRGVIAIPSRQISQEQQDDDVIEDMAIRVIVRKRPISKLELSRGDKDCLEILRRGRVLVHEPKVKVDLTKYTETSSFTFDDAFEAEETNEDIYNRAVKHLLRTVFEGGKASCFAYGQTGSGKTFTMMGSNPTAPSGVTSNAGLYVLVARDIFRLLKQPENAGLRVYVSCFEIYGGKLFDLLNERTAIKCLEDAKGAVQTPGLTEHVVESVDELLALMGMAHTQRSTGSTGANMESSRSHQILHLRLKDTDKSRKGTKNGQFSFIDLAGSERGSDTNHNSKQTRLEGAEINTSLLALKEVIRSLEKKNGFTPFRGSKLTQVLKDSFVGENTRTCMVACVSPAYSNCEHTLNTLRYADRVKEHQSNGDLAVAPVQAPVVPKKASNPVVISDPIPAMVAHGGSPLHPSRPAPLKRRSSVSGPFIAKSPPMDTSPISAPRSNFPSKQGPARSASSRILTRPTKKEPAAPVGRRPGTAPEKVVNDLLTAKPEPPKLNVSPIASPGISPAKILERKKDQLLTAHRTTLGDFVEVCRTCVLIGTF